ncbi:hypothetical protein ADUPG1_013803 [Aduncisulcus paluster]|uniref:Uncharacterized protein n=1 Tax=Aduncisulcus paluster TaxID=2918883 RepID=A0ABQ5K490_9EUKA|nr:hypothetical protein ADUPG1_013803 [Aduncisulcus paluster]
MLPTMKLAPRFYPLPLYLVRKSLLTPYGERKIGKRLKKLDKGCGIISIHTDGITARVILGPRAPSNPYPTVFTPPSTPHPTPVLCVGMDEDQAAEMDVIMNELGEEIVRYISVQTRNHVDFE